MISKEENLRLLQWIQDQGSAGTDQYFEYVINIGEKNEFQIRIIGGQLSSSEPDEMLSNLSEYEKLNVQIFEKLKTEPRSLDNLNVWQLSGIPIFPDTDYRFSNQSWTKNCQIITRGTAAKIRVNYFMASPDTVCDIVRHCQKLVGMKAFW